jgi:hypothetical protein
MTTRSDDDADDDETEEEGPYAIILRIAAGIGFDGDLTHAAWGRVFAQRLRDEGSDEAVDYALAQFGAHFRSKHFSDARGRVRITVEAMARSGTAAPSRSPNGNGAAAVVPIAAVEAQLRLPITVRDEAPKPAGDCNHWYFTTVARYVRKKMRGLGQYLETVEHFGAITKPWPDDKLRVLVADGRVTPAQIAAVKPAALNGGDGEDGRA